MLHLATETILLCAALSAAEAEGCGSARKRQAAAAGVGDCFFCHASAIVSCCATAPLLDPISLLCKVMLQCLTLSAAGIRHMGAGAVRSGQCAG